MSKATLKSRLSKRDAAVVAAVPGATAIWRAKGGLSYEGSAERVDDAAFILFDLPVGPGFIGWALAYARERGTFYIVERGGRELLAHVPASGGVELADLSAPDAKGRYTAGPRTFWRGRRIA